MSEAAAPAKKSATPMSLILSALFLSAGTAPFLALAPGGYEILNGRCS